MRGKTVFLIDLLLSNLVLFSAVFNSEGVDIAISVVSRDVNVIFPSFNNVLVVRKINGGMKT